MKTIIRLISMFGPLRAAKFWVAVVMAVVQFVQIYLGLDLGLDQQTVTAVIAGIAALLVWLVPNKQPIEYAGKDHFPPAPKTPGLY